MLVGSSEMHSEDRSGVLEIRRFGLKITGWKPWHTGVALAGGTILGAAAIGGAVYLGGMLIGGTLHLGSEALGVIKQVIELLASAGTVLFSARCGSLELVVFTENEESKQKMIKLLQSNELSNRIESIVGKPNIKVELTQLGTVIATEEEFAKLQKNMRKKLEAIEQKIYSYSKATMLVGYKSIVKLVPIKWNLFAKCKVGYVLFPN